MYVHPPPASPLLASSSPTTTIITSPITTPFPPFFLHYSLSQGVRIVMIGTLTGLQWWIYDTFKTLNGMGTSGGVQKKHDDDEH
jgi:hypothetical protein